MGKKASDVLDLELVHGFIMLQEKKAELEAELRMVRQNSHAIELLLIDAFLQQGIQNMTAGQRIIYIHTQQWAKPRDRDKLRAVHALMDNGYENYVGPNTQSVSALFRGSEEEVTGLPPEIQEAFEVTEVTSLRSRKA